MTKLKLTALVLSFALLSSLASFAQVTGVGLRITEDVTLTVGNSSNAQFATIHEALDCLADKFIPGNVTVTIWVEPGEYTYDETVNVNHGNGDRIHIVGGDPESRTDVTLNFLSLIGFNIEMGHTLGKLQGINLNKVGGGDSKGIRAFFNTNIVASNISINNFNHGIHLSYSSMLQLSNSSVTNFWVGVGAFISSSCIIQGTTFNNGTYGLYISTNSYFLGKTSNSFSAVLVPITSHVWSTGH
jgi:hypothetical protein